jgi:hypothetical protein
MRDVFLPGKDVILIDVLGMANCQEWLMSNKLSSKASTELEREIGSDDGLIDLMRRCNIPITRENYLDLAGRAERGG